MAFFSYAAAAGRLSNHTYESKLTLVHLGLLLRQQLKIHRDINQARVPTLFTRSMFTNNCDKLQLMKGSLSFSTAVPRNSALMRVMHN